MVKEKKKLSETAASIFTELNLGNLADLDRALASSNHIEREKGGIERQ